MIEPGGELESRDAARAAAWDAECLDRERRECTIGLLCTGILIPVWIGLDAVLEPDLVRPFLSARILGSAASWILLAALRRARTLGAVRAITAGVFALTSPCIALMLPHVRHFSPYLFGFSLYFWGAGALFSWPLRYAAASFAWLLATFAALLAVRPGVREPADLAVAAFYLGSAAVISCGMTYSHRRSARRAFDASFALEARNVDLAGALAQLRDAQGRLVASEKASALGRLLAGLSHEINNPMNVLHNNLEPVRGYLDDLVEIARLATSGRGEDQARARELAAELDVGFVARDLADATDAMRSAVDRIRRIHEDLRVFIRGGTPERSVGDLNEGLGATVALVSRRLPPGVAIDAALSALPPIAFRPGQLEQVWHNLLQNALDAVGARGRISVRSRTDGDFVEVSIADDGPGVAAEHRPRLFEPFFTTKAVGKGTGLGLATSHEIVAGHGGSMRLDPDHAPGARFVVRLPASRREPAAGAA